MISAEPDPAPLLKVHRAPEGSITFVDHPDFARPELAAEIKADWPAVPMPAPAASHGNSAYFRGLFATPLLNREQEIHLFRQMNYFKFLAAQIERQTQRRSGPRDGRRIDGLLAESRRVRDRIVRANLRLVVSWARRLVKFSRLDLHDLVSEGNFALLQAVETFDCSRGYRFSTYATHAVRNSLCRHIGRELRRGERFVTGSTKTPEPLCSDAESRESAQGLLRWSKELPRLLARLAASDRVILTARFGLDGGEGQTYSEIAARLGLSKERTRQLALRAIDRLRGACDPEANYG